MCADQTPQPRPSRRRAIEIFLGGGILASLASFLYPVLRYFVPPAVVDLGGDEVVAAKMRRFEAEYRENLPLWQPSGPVDPEQRRHLSRSLRHLYPPRLHGAISPRSARDLVRMPQRHLRSEWPQRFRPSAQTARLCSMSTCAATKSSSTGNGRRDRVRRPHSLAR